MIVLASASPRRQELLRNAGISFLVQPADINETPLANESPQNCAKRLARDKALAISQSRPQDYVLGADTIVVIDNSILGKPRDAADAGRMLRLLSGRTHKVVTGVCLVTPSMRGCESTPEGREVITVSESTLVSMDEITEQEIRDYIATGEPMDKAGAYAIQGIASRWITCIDGDYSNVVGLPVRRVYSMLRKQGAL
ncbi:MAG: Maf family protein [Candidatus Sulfotelmatobacter sp.]|jgi:septum formation protein